MNDLNMFKLKNLLLDKEFCIANANRDLAVGDRWTAGWDHLMKDINIEIDQLIKEIEKVNNRKSPPPTETKRPVGNIDNWKPYCRF
ncbi:hypothetical protein [Silvanigrella sp.]|jgi:hypothetical protein|uniref:hypothetical protein n=1 Tax=Silvanigrella sp. TaxID=2024976 RepID=UPI0037C9994B